MSAGPIAGYMLVEAGGARAVAVQAAAPWLEKTLRDHGTLRDWAVPAATAVLVGGREGVRVVAAPVRGPDSATQWACRRYLRGGWAAALLGDRYLRSFGCRPMAELLASHQARARGVRTPAVVAAAWYPRGMFYRADLVTELVQGTHSLAEALFAPGAEPARGEPLAAAGRLVRSLEEAAVEHADLNAGNVLVSSADPQAPAWVVDLDRCRVHGSGTQAPGLAMRRRLERSLVKLGGRRGRPLTAADWEALRDGYAGRS